MFSRGLTHNWSKAMFSRHVILATPRFLCKKARFLSTGTSSGKSSAKNDDDFFLSRHGGKVALVGFSFAFLLFYKYYRGTKNKSSLETSIRESQSLEPFEVLEIRDSNTLTLDDFSRLRVAAQSWEYSVDHPWELTYPQFRDAVQASLGKNISIRSGHLFDRWAHAQCNAQCKSDDQDKKFDVDNLYFPIGKLFVLLELAQHEDVEARLKNLYNIGIWESNLQDSNTDSTLNSAESSGPLRMKQVIRIIQYLIDTNQVPCEKMVAETGEKYPFLTYRQKTGFDMMDLHYHLSKKTLTDDEPIDQDTFDKLLTSSQVCVWGECFRRKKIDN